MKKFILLFLSFWIGFFSIVGGIRFTWFQAAPYFMQKDFINNDINTIVLGPSNGLYSWNDSIIPHSKNLCAPGNSLGSCYSMLRRIVENNNNQVDTVLLCASAVAIAYYHDGIKTYLLKNHLEDVRNIFNYEIFFKHYCKNPEYWKMTLTTIPLAMFRLDAEGEYSYLDRNKLDHPLLYQGIREVMELAGGGKDAVTERFLRENCTYQLDNLCLIKEYCDNHHITLVLLTPPLYKIPEIMSDKGYYELICKELGDSTLVADYSKMKLPKDYYADLEHVNWRGARAFSNYIVKAGLNIEYAIEHYKNTN